MHFLKLDLIQGIRVAVIIEPLIVVGMILLLCVSNRLLYHSEPLHLNMQQPNSIKNDMLFEISDPS